MAEYAELISSTHKSFSIEDDIGAIARISESLQTGRTHREKRRQESRQVLLELSRTLENAKNRLEGTRSPTDHGMVMNALDREKFGLAKGINELESQTHVLESTMHRLQSDLENLEMDVTKEPAAFEHDEATVLKLSVYRDLGITLKENQGVYDRAIIRSADGRDVHMVTLDKSGGSFSNHLWELCSS